MKRASDVLMHVSSLYEEYSIGSFGKEARSFIDFLAKSGFSYWQVLPFCMADECNSPYKSYSAFGGNPLFIDLPTLYERGWLTADELAATKQKSPYLCEYDRLGRERIALLKRAAARVGEAEKAKISDFIAHQKDLADAAAFLALREKNNGVLWHDWKEHTPDADELFF